MRISDVFAMGGGYGHDYSEGCYSNYYGDCSTSKTPIQLEGPDFRNDLRDYKWDRWAY